MKFASGAQGEQGGQAISRLKSLLLLRGSPDRLLATVAPTCASFRRASSRARGVGRAAKTGFAAPTWRPEKREPHSPPQLRSLVRSLAMTAPGQLRPCPTLSAPAAIGRRAAI